MTVEYNTIKIRMDEMTTNLILLLIIIFIIALIGLYSLLNGIWCLRKGTDKKKEFIFTSMIGLLTLFLLITVLLLSVGWSTIIKIFEL